MRRIAIIVFVGLIWGSVPKKLPASFKICDHFAPNLNDCLKVAVKSALEQLANGIPEIDAPPIEPLEIPSSTINTGGQVMTFKNLKMYNLVHATIEDVMATVTTQTFLADMVITAKEVIGKSDYSYKGKIMLLTIDGAGKAVFTLRENRIKASMVGQTVNINGNVHYQLTNFTMDIQPKHVSFDMDNLIRGNEELSKGVNKVLNENWEEFYAIFKEDIEEIISTVYKAYANNILKYVPVQMNE